MQRINAEPDLRSEDLFCDPSTPLPSAGIESEEVKTTPGVNNSATNSQQERALPPTSLREEGALLRVAQQALGTKLHYINIERSKRQF